MYQQPGQDDKFSRTLREIRALNAAPAASDEQQFRSWYAERAARLQLDPNPDNPLHEYDWRGAFRTGAEADQDGHWPSEFKRPGHPNLIVDGVDTSTGQAHEDHFQRALAEIRALNEPPPQAGFLARLFGSRGFIPGMHQPAQGVGGDWGDPSLARSAADVFKGAVTPGAFAGGMPAIETTEDPTGAGGSWGDPQDAIDVAIGQADPNAIGREVIPGKSVTYGPVSVEADPIRGGDVLGAVAATGTAAKEYGYMRALGPVAAQVTRPLVQGAAALERRFAPRVAQFFEGLAGRSTGLSRVSGGVEGAAAAGPEAMAFGAMRETLEGQPVTPEALAAYGAAGVGFGGALGAAGAPKISLARAVSSPSDVARVVREDPYRVLGVKPDSPEPEIDAAFRARMSAVHPDNPAAPPDAQNLAATFSEARAAIKEIRHGKPKPVEEPQAAPPTEDKMPDWAREKMTQEGLDPKRPLNDIDIRNPTVRAAVEADPTLTPEQKANVLATGSPDTPAQPKKGKLRGKQPAPPSKDMEAVVLRATRSFTGAEGRWNDRIDRGMTDDEIHEALGEEFGIQGGSSFDFPSGNRGFYNYWGGKNPRLEIDGEKLQGKPLVSAVRQLLGIPEPVVPDPNQLEIPPAAAVEKPSDETPAITPPQSAAPKVTPQVPMEEGTKYVLPSFVTQPHVEPKGKLKGPQKQAAEASENVSPVGLSPANENASMEPMPRPPQEHVTTPEPTAQASQPVVQKMVEEEGAGASEEEIGKLVRMSAQNIQGKNFPTDPKSLRKWAGDILGRPYESRTWRTDDVYDALEGGANEWVHETIGPIRPTSGRVDRLKFARQVEENIFQGRLRSAGMLARQQFSTPLPIAEAAAQAADMIQGEKVLEPTAGTGNLVNSLRGGDYTIDVNEIEPRRVAVLRALELNPTTEDALKLQLSGKRYNAIVTNPPYGFRATGKYSGGGALPFADSDVSQRFAAAAMNSLIDGGRLVAVMPPNVATASAAAFNNWLRENHTPVAYIESPEGAYEGRGTGIGTVLLVVDKGKVQGAPAPMSVKAPTWDQWYKAIEQLSGGGSHRRLSGRGVAEDVAAVEVPKAEAKGPKPQAKIVDRAAPEAETPVQQPAVSTAQEIAAAVKEGVKEGIKEAFSGTAGKPEPAAGGPVASGDGSEPAATAGTGSAAKSERPGTVAESGTGRDAGVVAEPSPGAEGPAVEAGETQVVPRGVQRRVEPRASDSPERRREIEDANDSPVFAPYALGIEHSRAPHPRLVVETRSMAGMPAPAITAEFQSQHVEKAWGRAGSVGGISDEQAEAVLRALTAWDRGHGLLFADDVGVGKTREGAALVLEAIARGKKRILYTTKNRVNLGDVMKELKLVASGKEDGEFPAHFIFVPDYKNVKKGTESLPQPDRPTVYFLDAANFAPYADALKEVGIEVWIADEAHEFKNQFTGRGMAWRELHSEMLARNGLFAYLTATPAVTLDELGYLYGLKEWVPGGFADWVNRKLGKSGKDSIKVGEGEKDAAEAQAAEEAELGDRSGMSSELEDADAVAGGKKKPKFMRNRPDVFAMRITPAETEQVMRELKGQGKYIARDLWRGGVEFKVHEVDLLGSSEAATIARVRYNHTAELVRDITSAARQFGRMNEKVKTTGAERALIQSYMKQLLFDMRLDTVLKLADDALGRAEQVVISVHSVAGDVEAEEGLADADVDIPLNKRLEAAINRINTRNVEKHGSGEDVTFEDLGDIPEALMVRADLIARLRELKPLRDPVRTVEEHFGAKQVAAITGKVAPKDRTKLMAEFQSGARKVALISKAGKVGISLHDVNGKKRHMLVADYEWSADTFKQELGRVDRTGQRSKPSITLVASNLAGEKKFAGTIAARMSSLGATSKGASDATGTDALDQFDYSNDIARDAMKTAVERMSDPAKRYFTGSKFMEWQRTGPEGQGELTAKKRPDDASIKDFLLEMMMFPVEDSNEAWELWVQARDELMTGEAQEAQAARRTAKLKGTVLRRSDLSKKGEPHLTLFEVKNAAGEARGILQGFVTEYIEEIQLARGTEHGMSKSRRYIQFTTDEGELISGLEVTPAEAGRIRELFGMGGRRVKAEDVYDDLQAGEKHHVEGPDGADWLLHRRQDGRIQIKGARLSKHKDALQGLAKYESVGDYLFIPDDRAALLKFLERFPVKQPEKKVEGKTLADRVKSMRASDPDAQLVAGAKQAVELDPGTGYHGKGFNILGYGQRQRLIKAVAAATKKTQASIGELNDAQIIERAVQARVIDDETRSGIQRAIDQYIQMRRGGFVFVGGRAAPPAGPTPPDPNAPVILVDNPPRGAGIIEKTITPPSRVARKLMRSDNPREKDIGEKLDRLILAGQDARDAFSRHLATSEDIRDRALKGLKAEQQSELVELLDTIDTVDGLPDGTSERIREAFATLRAAYREDWRALGRNERNNLSNASREILDLALKEWPEGGEAPDFDNIPVNRANILAAAGRGGGLSRTPTTREGWEELVHELKASKRRVQTPVFMESPDLQRIYGMIQGRGGIQAYFSHVFSGDWVVRAGEHTKRFVDRVEAVDYARKLIDEGAVEEGVIRVEKSGFVPEAEVYLSRKHFFALANALEKDLHADTKEVHDAIAGAGKIRQKPRRRWFAHMQKRETNLQTFERDPEVALKVYHYRLAKKLAFDPFRKIALDIAEKLPIEGGWREFANSYIADTQGVPGEYMQALEHSLEQLPLLSGRLKPFLAQRAATSWQKWMSRWHLGYSPISAAINLTQTAITTVPSFDRPVADGVRLVMKAASELARGTDEAKEIVDFVGVKLHHPKYIAGEYLPRGVKVDEDYWLAPLYLFNKAEDVNRSLAAIAWYHYRREHGYTKTLALHHAKRFVRETHFDYSAADAPKVMRNPVGRAMLQFKQYPLNMWFFGRDLFAEGNPKQWAAFSAAMMVFGGLAVLATATPLWVLNWLLGPHRVPGTGEDVGLFHDDETGEPVTPWADLWDNAPGIEARPLLASAKYGLLALFGLDISQRTGFGAPRDFNATIPGSKLKDLVAALTGDDVVQRERAMKRLMPSAVKRLVDAWETSGSGEVRDAYGRLVDSDVSATDVAAKALGVQTVEQAERSQAMQRERKLAGSYDRRRADYLEKARRELADGQLAAAHRTLREANDAGVNISINDVRAREERRDEPALIGRIRRTPKDVREAVFTDEEMQEYNRRQSGRRRRLRGRSR